MSPNINILPPLITASKPNFVSDSLNERIPKIVTKIIDQLSRYFHEAVERHGEVGGEEVTAIIAKLSELKYQMITDKPLEYFEPNFPDYEEWNQLLDGLKLKVDQGLFEALTWYRLPFLFVECYLYQRIWGYFLKTKSLINYDYFGLEKQKAYEDSMKHIISIGTELINLVGKNLDSKTISESLLRFLQIALWGNKCDLSLSAGDPHSMSATIFHELEIMRPNILADNLGQTVDQFLTKLQPNDEGIRRIDIILDNSGLEVFVDLCLADFMLSNSLADKVVFHGKAIPWFVSDVTNADMKWILKKLDAESDPFLNKLGKRWNENFHQGAFEFQAHKFWTSCFSYSYMAEKAEELYSYLKKSSFIIFKGDLNYRKLTGDREWPHTTEFRKALLGFEPAPLLTLRTLKAETVAGLPKSAVELIRSKFPPENLTWMYSSDYAVAQLFCGSDLQDASCPLEELENGDDQYCPD